jgi:hypothetical protein
VNTKKRNVSVEDKTILKARLKKRSQQSAGRDLTIAEEWFRFEEEASQSPRIFDRGGKSLRL